MIARNMDQWENYRSLPKHKHSCGMKLFLRKSEGDHSGLTLEHCEGLQAFYWLEVDEVEQATAR
jgi:hypothetical protein